MKRNMEIEDIGQIYISMRKKKIFFFHLWFKRSNETKYFLQNHILQTKAGLLIC